MKNVYCITSSLEINCHFKMILKKIAQNTGGKGLTHGTKHCQDNQLQTL